MRLLALKLKNYRQFQEAEIDFPDGVIGITGLNGAGKSSLVEAIGWALYGNLASRTEKEGIKRNGAPPHADCLATLTLEIAGMQYQVSRLLKGSSQSALGSIICQGKIIADSARGVDKEINHILGMDYKSFFTSFFARQKELNALTDLTPNQRKDVIMRMLRIDAVDQTINEIRKDAREKKLETEMLQSGLKKKGSLEIEIEAKSSALKRSQRQLAEVEKNLRLMEERLANFNARFTEERHRFEAFSKLQTQQEKLKEKLADLKAHRQELIEEQKNTKEQIHDLNEKEKAAQLYLQLKKQKANMDKQREDSLEQLNQREKDVATQAATLDANLATLRKKFKELEDSRKMIEKQGRQALCPTCQRPLEDDYDKILEHFDHELTDIKAEGKLLNEQKTTLAAKQTELAAEKNKLLAQSSSSKAKKTGTKPLSGFDPAAYQNLLEQLAAAETAKDEYLELKAIAEKLPKLAAQIERADTALQSTEAKLKETTAEIKLLAFDKQQYAQINEEFAGVKDQIDAHYAERNRLKIEYTAGQKELEHTRKELENLRTIEEQIKHDVAKQESLTRLANLMINFRTHLISRIRPELSRLAGELFATLTNHKYSGIELDDNYEMHIFDGGIKYPITRFSGGEADLANLCLRLSISNLIAKSTGTEGGFIILDEIFGSQDPLRKKAIMEALTLLAKQYQQIILITHIDDIKDQVENLIEVVEGEDGISAILL
jgi:exonuclease SbcC